MSNALEERPDLATGTGAKEPCGFISDRQRQRIKNGDFVYTTAGCRINGAPGYMVVVDADKHWGKFPAAMCQKADGKKRLFLIKNLRHAHPDSII